MAIHKGHEFKKEHGYTGSAHPGKDHSPKIHGYKRGGGVNAGDAEEAGAFVHGAKEHYGSGGHTDHDGEQHIGGRATYDKHGFQHCKHGGKAKHHKE